jgi:Bacterial Ig domain
MRALLTASCCALVVSLLFSGCGPMASEKAVPQVGSVHTWIDAPLDGSTIPLAPYQVVMHAYDAGGVSEVELSANGSLLATLPNADAELNLATFKYDWSPPAPGNYTLSARAKGGNGLAGSEARANVTVLGEVGTAPPSFTPTPVVSFTPTLVVSFTPTLVPSFTPTPVPAGLAFTPQISANQFYYGNCGSNQVTIQVQATGPNLSGVLMFLNLKDQSTGEATGWDGGSAMTPSGNGWFSRTVNSSSLAGAGSMSQAWLLYQFIATDSASKIIGRSDVYSDISLTSCGPVFQRIVSPTPVQQFRRVPSPTPVPQFRRIATPTLIPPPP